MLKHFAIMMLFFLASSCGPVMQTKPMSLGSFAISQFEDLEIFSRPLRDPGIDAETIAIYRDRQRSFIFECRLPSPPSSNDTSHNLVLTSRARKIKMIVLDSGRLGVVLLRNDGIDCIGGKSMPDFELDAVVMPMISPSYLNRVKCKSSDCLIRCWLKKERAYVLEIDDLK